MVAPKIFRISEPIKSVRYFFLGNRISCGTILREASLLLETKQIKQDFVSMAVVFTSLARGLE